VQEGDANDDKSKAFDTKQLNLSLPTVAHLGFHVHPTTTPITKATHIGTRNTIVPVPPFLVFPIIHTKPQSKPQKQFKVIYQKTKKNKPDNNHVKEI
jgi:hypothetical protein